MSDTLAQWNGLARSGPDDLLHAPIYGVLPALHRSGNPVRVENHDAIDRLDVHVIELRGRFDICQEPRRMISAGEFVRSVGLVWLAWAVSVIGFSVLTARGLSSLWHNGWRHWHEDDSGAAYTLSYVMTFPIYGLFMALIVETSLMLSCKIGTVYAAYAAARSAVVWSSAQPGAPGSAAVTGRARERMRRAAVHALVPFASASPQHAFPGGGGDGNLSQFLAAYRAHYSDDATTGYLTRKYRYSSSATEVTSENLAGHEPTDDIVVTVRFHYPFILPGIGRLLGAKPFGGAKFYTALLETQAKLQSETPRSKSRTLGIQYRSE
jgi:hypothetical protein